MADVCGVPFLGRIPLDPNLAQVGDEGGFLKKIEDSPTITSIQKIVDKI